MKLSLPGKSILGSLGRGLMIDLNVPSLERNSVFSGLLLVISLNLVSSLASLLFSVYSSFSSIEVCPFSPVSGQLDEQLLTNRSANSPSKSKERSMETRLGDHDHPLHPSSHLILIDRTCFQDRWAI